MSKIEILKKIDLLGFRPSLYYKNRLTYKTACGGVSTLLLVGLFACLSLLFGKELFDRSNPTVNASQKTVEVSKVSLRDLSVMMSITSLFGDNLLENSDFKEIVSISPFINGFELVEGSYKPKIVRLEYVPCTEELFDTDYLESFEEIKLSNFICLNPEVTGKSGEKEEIFIQNESNDPNSQKLFITIGLCTAKKDDECLKKKDKFAGFEVSVWLKTQYFDTSTPGSFLKHRTFKLTSYVSPVFEYSEQISLLKTIINEDNGVLFIQTSETTYNSVSTTKGSVKQINPNFLVFYSLTVDCPRLQTVKHVKYAKLPELLANLNVLMKIGIIFFKCVSSFYSKYAFFVSISKVDKVNEPTNTQLNRSETVIAHSRTVHQEIQINKPVPSLLEFWFFSFLSTKKAFIDLSKHVSSRLSVEQIVNKPFLVNEED